MGIFGPIITAVGLPRRKETRYVSPNLNIFHTKRDYRTRFLVILREMMGMKIAHENVHMCNAIGEIGKKPFFIYTIKM